MTDFSRKTLTGDRILQCDSTINTFKSFIHLFIYSFVHLSIYGSPAARAARMRAMAGYQRRRGSRVHMAVDTLGHLLAVHVTPADEQMRAQVRTLCAQVQYRLPATGHRPPATGHRPHGGAGLG